MSFVGDTVAIKQFDMTVHARRKTDLIYRKATCPAAASGHRLDDAGKLLTHDQRRTERQRVADGAEHDIVFEET
jgi:hypothetical protein